MELSIATRSFLADTLALVTFFTVTSGLNERFVVGMAWEQVLVSRSIGAVLMLPSARPYGLWRNWFLAKARPSTWLGYLLADSAALLLFQVPIYFGIVLAGGADLRSALLGSASFAVLVLVLGRPYGLWLEFVRRRFGLDGPGRKPMSLGG
ncbi:L-alanine exporter AlaE [Aureimonas leprariae]|uniref:L-alanine exporter AlaE n=1 Tax=Plantimonas leprariae TaxID=2615207 RepID=A0A7V7PMG6_9HYPH|nr:L-alanine exporter AlaE [Aureimonas leprariae]KAB0678029.1 L-alanine exporter AlaE [Aureimonas leprariae]